MCMAVQLLPQQASDGGPWVVAGYEDGTLALWAAAAPARPAAFAKLHAEAVMALALDGSGQGEAPGCIILFTSLHRSLRGNRAPSCALQVV